MSKKRQQTLDPFAVKNWQKNEETSVQETGNNVSAQSVGLLDMISPICDTLSKASGTINNPGQHE